MHNTITNPPNPKNSHTWTNLHGCSSALTISSLYRKLKKPMLVIVPNITHGNKLLDELKYFNNNSQEIFFFPDHETLPYDQISPHSDIISQRIKILYKLLTLPKYLVIVSINTICQILPPISYIKNNTLILTKNEKFSLSAFRLELEKIGYYHTSQVFTHGEYSVKGGIIDIFPMGGNEPYRIELFDEDIESIRVFNPENQLSTRTVEKINIMPANEIPLNDSNIEHFQKSWKNLFDINPKKCPIYQSVSKKQKFSGMEYYLPLFFDSTNNFLDYLNTETIVVTHESNNNAHNKYLDEMKFRFDQLNVDKSRSLLPPEMITMDLKNLHAKINSFPNVLISNENILPNCDFGCFQNNIINKIKDLTTLLEKNKKNLLLAESLGRKEILLSFLNEINIHPVPIGTWHDFLSKPNGIYIGVSPIMEGFICEQEKLSIITEHDINGHYHVKSSKTKTKTQDISALLANFNELEVNSSIVHMQYGVGLYKGLRTIETQNHINEYICLEYDNNDLIYVPITSLHLISRYSLTDNEQIKLSKLGSNNWVKTKKQALLKIQDIAAELLDIYARRAKQKGHKFILNKNDYNIFCSKFPYEETPDQLKAINDVINDMTSNKLTDRLICGDVGFGKTEIAMRAAFIAANNHKQIAILVPTTILALQHYETFLSRFANFDITIDCLSRFKTAKQKERIKNNLQKGTLDIVIGTHALLQKTVSFNDLGLLIIDEEHRFGVKHKEHIQSIKNSVDVLTLTATPIPRTLNSSLSGIKDISIIATPPEKRLAVKTIVDTKKDYLIREASLREIMRGGQVYYLHNNISTIQLLREKLTKLLPEASIKIAHGQLPKDELEQIMVDFYHNHFNFLLCTTIIETGLDVPTANTIIIDRADKFGLAQLHQLRGRVGRSHHQAYAYLTIPEEKYITKDAKKRLDALASLEDLGVGFILATHDLEIRGAGEILGQEQSGATQMLGFSLFNELLEKTVKSLKNKNLVSQDILLQSKCEVNLTISAIIPPKYISSVKQRLIMYKRIANANAKSQLRALQIELIDRYGLIPQETKDLFEISKIKLVAEQIGITKIEMNSKGGFIEFSAQPKINIVSIVDLVKTKPNIYSFADNNKLLFKKNTQKSEQKITFIADFLQHLSTSSS